MYVFTEETRELMKEVRDFIIDGKAIPGAPEGTQEKYDKMMILLEEEQQRQLEMMYK